GEHGTGRMTGARYLHPPGRNAKGPFVRYELTPENAGQLEPFIDQAQVGTVVLTHPDYLTPEQQHHLAR
ncbi:two-component system response regulator PgtA, partial [Salmonella enterica]